MRRQKAEAQFPWLGEEVDFDFPPATSADRTGIVCSGGNLSPGLLLSAYRRGIFPWFSEGEPILWWSPEPRFVLPPKDLHVSATMRKILRRFIARPDFELCLDRDFPAVIEGCAAADRKGQNGTWITAGMIEGYLALHQLGLAHSVELRLDGKLAGGLYGVSLGSIFFGESMFSRVDDASKAAFIPLVWRLREEGFTLVDSQVYTDHMAGLGAKEISRSDYLSRLAAGLEIPTRKGDWAVLFPDFPLSAEYRRIALKEPV